MPAAYQILLYEHLMDGLPSDQGIGHLIREDAAISEKCPQQILRLAIDNFRSGGQFRVYFGSAPVGGTNFGWREVNFILAPNSDYSMAEKRIVSVIEKVYGSYRHKIEDQGSQMERTFSLPLEIPKP